MRARFLLWLVVAGLAGGRVAVAATAVPIIACNSGHGAFTLTGEPASGVAVASWRWTSDGHSGSGAAPVTAVVHAPGGWHLALAAAAPAPASATAGADRRDGADHVLLVDDGTTLLLSPGMADGGATAWTGCTVDAARLQALAPTPAAAACTPATVQRKWLARARQWDDGPGAADSALALCRAEAVRVAEDNALALAVAKLMLKLDAAGNSTSRWRGVFAVPAALAAVAARCEEVLRAANSCHNRQCVTVESEIRSGCAHAAAGMAGAM